MTVDKTVLNSLQESIQIWDAEGKKLFCNNQTCNLFDVKPTKTERADDLFSQWRFYDMDEQPVSFKKLPLYQTMESGEPCQDVILKMVLPDQVKWVKMGATPYRDDAGKLEAIVTTMLDITAQKVREEHFQNIANYDPLTKLPNRVLLADRLELAVSHADRTQKGVAVCMIDLDGFKEVNDVYGHETGDAVLVEAAARMIKAVRAEDTVSRLGGDEFVVVLNELAKNEDAALTLYRLLNALSAPYNVEGHTITTISASIGVSMYPDDKVEAGALLRHADVAMYKSKNKGKNRFTFFDIVSDQKIKANYKTINRIKDSLESGEFCLYYQPKVNAVAGKIVEVEALARWNHPLLGLVSPAEFLPLVENDDTLSDQFDRWVVQEAIEQLLSWQDEGLFIKICVNISPRQFRHRHFTQWLGELIDAIGVDRELLSYLEFEILETAAVESLDRSNEVIKECKALGITFALDDFGTGYSSMMHLKELHVDTIKIDRLFVTGMLENAANLVIVQAIVALGNAFDITVTAEGAERIDEVISLLEMGCDDIQGFAIARPMPKEELKEFVLGFEPDPRWKIASQSLPSKIDFELLLASSNHKYWLELVLEAFSDDTIDAQWLALDYSQCRFGKWFEKKRAEHYPMTPGFNDIDALHRQMHAYVKELYELLSSEKRKIKEDEKDTLLGMSKKLTTVLEEVRKEVVNVKKQSDLVNKILEKRRQYER